MDEDRNILERKRKFLKFIKEKYHLFTYVLLAVIVFLAVRIRTLNLYGLKDITTGTWTLGPDLDPFLFLRWAKYIVENGSLMALDTMRYVPLGFETGHEYLLHPYMIAWFHNVISLFGSESVTQSAVLYPVFFFAITVIAFFLFARRIFLKKYGVKFANGVGLISALFLSIIPALLPRTIAGIPEKESAAFFFLFMALYLFISGWESEKKYAKYVFAILSGLATAGMASIWGGYVYIFLVIAPAVFIAFILRSVNLEKTIVYGLWLITSSSIMVMTHKYIFGSIFASTATAIAFGVLFTMALNYVFFETKLKRYFDNPTIKKFPKEVTSTIISGFLGAVLFSVAYGFSQLISRIIDIKDVFIKPATTRLIQTVAENRQPYFQEWVSSFGPIYNGIPVYFWLFFVGSIFLVYLTLNFMKKKEQLIMTSAYVIFLLSFIFGRYSSSSLLNGENFASIGLYILGFGVLIGAVGFYYYKYYKTQRMDEFKKVGIGIIILIVFFLFGVISAKAAVRTVMVLVPPASIVVGFFLMSLIQQVNQQKQKKVASVIIAAIVLFASLFSAYYFYQVSASQASSYVPSAYNQQWQKAMAWVRENTPQESVFAHWWDYGYWLQSIGERATVLDGGNSVSYWNHLMGRYALTGNDEKAALEFLYAHNVTHFLIDSSDIGKYPAYSLIGSDKDYDRASYLSIFLKDSSRTFEAKNSTKYLYLGGTILDEDLSYNLNGTQIFLPGSKGDYSNNNIAGIGGVVVGFDENQKVDSAEGIFVYRGTQYNLPLRYIHFNGTMYDLGEGLDAGAFIFPQLSQSSGGMDYDESGAMIFLSKRTIHSQFAKLYLFEEDVEGFSLVHEEKDFLIKQLESQSGLKVGDFVYFQGARGPIKIWEIDYSNDVKFRAEFLQTKYPEEIRSA